MDIGCIDMGCVEKQRKEIPTEKENSPKESKMSASKLGKNTRTKDSVRSSSNALNKLASQIAKPPHRKTSPLTWFPRKKVEPYLRRKIKLLQEVDGMQSTLDETLGDSNPHYSKVLREKIAIKEAADKAMEARKAAMIEASWCRILRAAGIESKVAEAQLLKAENSAAEAFEAAEAIGVILNDIPDSAQNRYKIETVSSRVGESATHTVSATFETVFEVDKQVAAAVKAAFIKLASCSSIKKDAFQELLHKISENPDVNESYRDFSLNLECEFNADKVKSNNVIELMLDRLGCLKEEELASLATIVATCGLNAALAENVKNPCPETDASRRTPFGGRMTSRYSISDAQLRRTDDSELPSLDKFLVKRLTRLEREVLEAKNAAKNEATNKRTGEKICSVDNARSRTQEKLKEDDTISDLKFEKEAEEAKELQKALTESVGSRYSISDAQLRRTDDAELPSLDKFLVKRLTRLEREVLEAKNAAKNEATNKRTSEKICSVDNARSRTKEKLKEDDTISDLKFEKEAEEAKELQKALTELVGSETKEAVEAPSLDKFLVKRLTKHEREVQGARNSGNIEPTQGSGMTGSSMTTTLVTDAAESNELLLTTDLDSSGNENVDMNRNRRHRNIGTKISQDANYESLDSVLVKHVSRMEREKMRFLADEQLGTKPKRKDAKAETDSNEPSLDQILVKHKSRLEREREITATTVQQDDGTRYSVSRRQAREKELQAAWGGLSLGNSMRPHISRLERQKANWLKAEEEERKRAMEEVV